MKIKVIYQTNKAAKVGDTCVCPSCFEEFVKTNYQQVFCKTKKGTRCKDKYWNTVTPEKRNNTTRISPASARFMASRPVVSVGTVRFGVWHDDDWCEADGGSGVTEN